MSRRMGGLAALAVVTVLSAGCNSLGGLGDVLGGTNNSLVGEVRSVDARRGRFQLREDYGRDHTIYYDSRTRVVYGQREYPVSALERGDRVQVRVEFDRNNRPWADRIAVRESARGRDGGSARSSARVQRVDGRVDRVDTRRGFFTVDRDRSAIVVYVPRDARSEDLRHFQRLRRGDRVRADVRSRGGSQAELVRFR